ncbi:MAG TPA: 2OG-Fe(II) oxygenase [Allosphingosinicella sp.]|jgi:prolyl 4-hydroxylase|nr:2OG-Fe(II) oxygenase [Allosphingosinicella sp.]
MADAESLFEAAAARLRGDGGARDLPGALELFRRSAGAGKVEAAVIYANLLAAGIGGPRRWGDALRLLAAIAQVNPRSRRELERIEAMKLTAEGDPLDPPEGERLCEAPAITRFERLFTAEECAWLAAAAAPMLEPAVVIDPVSARQRPDPLRVCDSVGFTWPLENPAIHALNRRIAAASGTAVGQGEPLQVLRYRPGGEYRPHFDAIPGFANQRAMTMLVWLNEDFAGGETHFPTAGLKLKGRAGDAILFRNTGPDGRPDPSSGHAGLPVRSGEKRIASRWIRERPFEMPMGGKAG